jgi:hypothetical protein
LSSVPPPTPVTVTETWTVPLAPATTGSLSVAVTTPGDVSEHVPV